MAEDESANGHSATHWWREAQSRADELAVAETRSSDLLERVSGLRLSLVEVMRKCWPGHVAGVEKALQGRLADLPDALLLGYLDAFAAMSAGGKVVSPNDLGEVRRALRDSGFPLETGATAVEMAVAIRSGFAAAKSENTRLRNRGRKSGGERRSVEKDLGWAEPQEKQNSDWGVDKPAQDDNSSKSTAGSSGRRKRKKSPAQNGTPKLFQEKTTGTQDEAGKPAATLDDWTVTKPGGAGDNAGLPDPDAPLDTSAVDENASRQDPDIVARIEATLMLPVPRFMQDVVGAAGSVNAASEWEQSQRSTGLVSFINPQTKHRQRGSLLIPKDTLRSRIPKFNNSPWGRAIAEGYPAGRLYELALVLRKLGDSIIAIGFHKHAVEITHRVAGGTSGVVVALSAGEDPWLQTEEAVGSLLGVTGLAQVEVLTCPAGAEDTVIGALATATKANGWNVLTPVSVESLNDWLRDHGRSAQPVPTS